MAASSAAPMEIGEDEEEEEAVAPPRGLAALDEDDPIVRTIDVVLCNTQHLSICQLGQPLRAPWRPYDYRKLKEMRFKKEAQRLEADVPLDTGSKNFLRRDDVASGLSNSKCGDKLTHRSQQVEQPTMTCIGSLVGSRLLLVRVDATLHMRPVLTHLNTIAKKGGKGDGGDAGDDDEQLGPQPASAQAVEVQVLKRETERQAQMRLQSFAHLMAQEEKEPWTALRVMASASDADKVWDKLGATVTNQPTTLSRSEYLAAFAPSSSNPLSAVCGYGADSSAMAAAAAAAKTTVLTVDQLSAECLAAFKRRVGALFEKHSVCALENVRQWLLDPRHATGEAAREDSAAAKDVTRLDDRSLGALVVNGAGLQLTVVRRVLVLRETGREETDKLRRVVVELLKDRDALRRGEVLEAANSKGIPVTDTQYNKVMKDLCVNRSNAWHLKSGADL